MAIKKNNNNNNTASWLLRLAVSVVINSGVVVDGAWSWQFNEQQQQQQESSSVSLNELQSYWMDTDDIINDLLNQTYDKLWIKAHSCVWSECFIDDTDDYYMGDNRDGDTQWYQYRTQGFCANAAYSLYGMRNTDSHLFRRGCTRRHFINSFFTYGGADNLLKAIGKTPVVYYNDNNDDGNNNGNGDDANDDTYSNSSANAVCVEGIDYELGDDDYFASKLNYNNNDDDNDRSGSNSNSGSQDQDNYYSGSLGCGSQGEYLIAAFQSSSCDGNYFAGVVNDFDEYNQQHDTIACHNIYDQQQQEYNNNAILNLLYNSWVCDMRLYPNGCPDPYQQKAKYDFAVKTASMGNNPTLAYRSYRSQQPLSVINKILLLATLIIVVLTYLVKNRYRAVEYSLSKGGGASKLLQGYAICLLQDVVFIWRQFCDLMASIWYAFFFCASNKCNQLNNTSNNKESSSNTNDDIRHVSSTKKGKNYNNDYTTSSEDSESSDYKQVED